VNSSLGSAPGTAERDRDEVGSVFSAASGSRAAGSVRGTVRQSSTISTKVNFHFSFMIKQFIYFFNN
jgi:hypothetical protein